MKTNEIYTQIYLRQTIADNNPQILSKEWLPRMSKFGKLIIYFKINITVHIL